MKYEKAARRKLKSNEIIMNCDWFEKTHVISCHNVCTCVQDVIYILPESIVIAVYWLVNSLVLVW